MSDILTIGGSAIRSLLVSEVNITDKVSDNIGQLIVHGGVSLPYITFNRMFGGLINNSPGNPFDMTWLVTAVAKTQPQAREIAGYISVALRGQEPTFIDGYKAYSVITETDPFLEFADLQNEQIWRAGAMYRLRGVQ